MTDLQAHAWHTGEPRRAIECGERARAIAEECGERGLLSQATQRLGYAYCAIGDYRRAIRLHQEALASPEPAKVPARAGLALVTARAQLAWCAAQLGEFAQGIAWGEEGLRIAEAANHPFSIVAVCWGLGYLYLIRGDPARAVAVLQRGVAVSQEWQVPLERLSVTAVLGYAYVLAGRIADGLPLLEGAVAEADRIGLMREQARRITWLGEAYLHAGRGPEAIAWAERALTAARQHQERGNEAWALRLLGEIAVHPEPANVDQAEEYYRDALALAEELRMRPLQAHCHLRLGTLYQRIGRRDQAQAELAAASEMYRAMDMAFWLARAEAELRATSA